MGASALLKELVRFYFKVDPLKKAYLERVSEKDENYIRAYYRNFSPNLYPSFSNFFIPVSFISLTSGNSSSKITL